MTSAYLIEQFASFRNVCCREQPEAWSFCRLRKSVQFDVSLHRHVAAQVGELHLYQLFRIERSMPVTEREKHECEIEIEKLGQPSLPASGNRFRENHPSCVYSLKYSCAVDTASNFFN